MSLCWKSVLGVAALTLAALPVAAQNQHEMTFHSVPPCTVFDTRVAGGAFAANETRTYDVVGTGSLAAQGGTTSSDRCGIPGFSNNIAQVQAVALVLTTVNPAGSGYVAANAADATLAGSVVTFSTGDLVTNTSPVAVAQTSGVGDFKVLVAFNGSHVVGRVVGYYMKPVQTVHVHPVPGDAAASGTALINAVNGITNASSTKRYVVKIEPGIYDVGSGLTMKPYVDLEGSGQKATVIQGSGSEDDLDSGVIEGANEAEVRDLQVHCLATTNDTCIAVFLPSGAHTTLRNVTLLASGAVSNYGIRSVGSSPLIEEATIRVSDGGTSYGISSVSQSNPTVKRSVIEIANEGVGYGMFFTYGAEPREVRDVQITVSGEATDAYGIFFDASFGSARITASTIQAEDGFSNTYGIRSSYTGLVIIEQSQVRAAGLNGIGVQAASVAIDHSEISGLLSTVAAVGTITGSSLNGGAAGSSTCAGVWDETPTFFAGPACP